MAFSIIIFTGLLLCIHFVLIENYRRWFLKMELFEIPENKLAITKFSIIIPARNEENNIDKCLQSIAAQDYPNHLFEIIVVDDYSTDNTVQNVINFQKYFPALILIQLEKVLGYQQLNSYKKKAIEIGITQATGDFIVTTDADCLVKKNWLRSFDAFINQTQAVFVAAPVSYIDLGSFISRFQCLDFMSLQGITAASVGAGFHSMCNGANLAYSKAVFDAVGGFKDIDNIASGDDMLLMHKIYKSNKEGVRFLFSQDAIVDTQLMPGWKDFINQRIRWASKADKFDDKRIIAVLAFIYLFNLSFIFIMVAAFWLWPLWFWLIAMLLFKTMIELRFMWPVAKFFNKKKILMWFPVMQPFHIGYTIVAGWLGKFGKYKWKGRQVK